MKKQFVILQCQMWSCCATGREVSTGSPVGNLKFLMKFSSSGARCQPGFSRTSLCCLRPQWQHLQKGA